MQNKLAAFFGEVQGEMKKVSWPTREELVGSSVVVIVMTVVLGFFIGACDLVISRIVNVLIR